MLHQSLRVRVLEFRSCLRGSDWTTSTTGNPWDSHAGKFLRHGIEGALGALIVLALASFWWPQAHIAAPAGASRTKRPSALRLTDWGNVLAASHLFGQTPANTAPAVKPAASPIIVEGIVFASAAGHSEAVLTISGKTNVYRVGDALPDGEKLTAINASGIELAANGSIRRMEMARYGSADSQGPAAYAALLHGTGLSNPGADNEQMDSPAQADAADGDTGQTFLSSPARSLYLHATPVARAVHLSPRASPLEQLRSLRAQLIRQ